MTSLIFLIVGSVAISYFANEKNELLILYIDFKFLDILQIIRSKNQSIIYWKMLGFKDEATTYDKEQLINQITLIYLLVFVSLNIAFYYKEFDEQSMSLVNNSFLTGLTVIQINWNKIVYYFRK